MYRCVHELRLQGTGLSFPLDVCHTGKTLPELINNHGDNG